MNIVSCGSHHNITFSHTQIEGSRHRQNQLSCEDVVLIHATQDYLFCGLADGQSGTKYGSEGGHISLKAILDHIDSVGIKNILDAPFPDELPYSFVKSFREKLLSMAESKSVSIKEFASTLLVIAVDLKSGKYVLLHLGDGCVISVPQTGDPVPISTPENGIAFYHTWLTTSDGAASHFRVEFGSIDNMRRLLLMSDGATCFCRGREIPWRAKDKLKKSSQSRLHEQFMQSNPSDDATCIIIDICESTFS